MISTWFFLIFKVLEFLSFSWYYIFLPVLSSFFSLPNSLFIIVLLKSLIANSDILVFCVSDSSDCFSLDYVSHFSAFHISCNCFIVCQNIAYKKVDNKVWFLYVYMHLFVIAFLPFIWILAIDFDQGVDLIEISEFTRERVVLQVQIDLNHFWIKLSPARLQSLRNKAAQISLLSSYIFSGGYSVKFLNETGDWYLCLGSSQIPRFLALRCGSCHYSTRI